MVSYVPTQRPTGLLVLQLSFRNSLELMFSASPSALLISKVLPKTLLNFIEFLSLCESRNIPFALPPMLFAQTVDLSVLTNVTPARVLLDIMFACTSTMSLECVCYTNAVWTYHVLFNYSICCSCHKDCDLVSIEGHSLHTCSVRSSY